MDAISEVGRSVEDLAVADLDQDAESVDDAASIALRSSHEGLGRIIRSLKDSVHTALASAERLIGNLQTDPDDPWRQAVETSAREYQAVAARLAAAGISNPDEYHALLDQQGALQREIEHLEHRQATAQEREDKARSVLDQYRSLRSELSRRRRRFADQASGDLVRVQIEAGGDRGNLRRFLRDTLGIAHFDQDHASLARRMSPRPDHAWTWQPLDNTVGALHEFVAGTRSWSAKDARFERALKRLRPEQLDRLALYAADDAVTVSFRDHRRPGTHWKRLAQGSPGQQTAALLSFVLGYGNEPIILDQPEDDLDNALIYELLVRRLREQKAQRQIIVVTHNPNIVVHGDAELAVSLDTLNGVSAVACSGGLQEPEVRDEICRVMEGGRDAFRERYRRIMSSGGSH